MPRRLHAAFPTPPPDRKAGRRFPTDVRKRVARLPAAVTAALALWLVSAVAATGAPAKPARAAHPQTLQTIVVTGSAVAVKQLDAGYNIHIANRTQIQQLNPFNTGELLEMVSPGTWSEPTGGESAGATIVAGFPNTNGAPFSTVMVNGAPLYGAAQLSFFDTSTLFRIDDTISRVEVVQGGTGAIVGPGQAGATANFILRTGGTTPAGDIGLTYGSEGRERVDGFVGVPLAHGWRASVGGFYRISNGIRDPQYKADQGGQLTATLKRATRHSKLVLWTRALNDKNLFLKQIPLIQAPDGSLHAYPGFNPLTGIYNSDAIAHSMVPNPAGGLKAADLPDGRGANLRFFGGDYKATLDGWTLADHMVASYGHLPGVALFPGSNPQPLGVYLYGCNVAQPAGFCTPAGEPVDTHTLKYPAGRAVQATLPDGDAVPLDQSVIVQQLTADYKRIWSLSNDFRASYEIFSGNTLTAGIYLARYGVNDNSSSGNQMLLLNQPHTLPVGITYTDGGQTFAQFNGEGLDFSHAKTALSAGTATNRALYLADTWTLGRWTLVAGGRIENENARSRTCKTHKVDLDGNPLTLFDNQAPVCNGQWDDEHYDKTHPSFALSANYQLSAHASVYANAGTGGHFDDFTHGIEQAGGDFPPLLKVKDVEVGFRYLSPHWFVNVNAYHRLFTGIQYQETDRNGIAIPGAISSYGSNAHGVNLIVRFSPTARLSLTLAGNVVRGHYTHNDACVPGFNVDGVAECLGFDGQPLARQPEVHYRFTPEYTVPTSFGNVTAWLAYTHIGQRYQDETGVQPLGVYNTLAAGIVANVGPAWQFRVQGTNLTNALGITEGNTAVLGSSTGASGVIMARPLFGREVFVAAKYRF